MSEGDGVILQLHTVKGKSAVAANQWMSSTKMMLLSTKIWKMCEDAAKSTLQKILCG